MTATTASQYPYLLRYVQLYLCSDRNTGLGFFVEPDEDPRYSYREEPEAGVTREELTEFFNAGRPQSSWEELAAPLCESVLSAYPEEQLRRWNSLLSERVLTDEVFGTSDGPGHEDYECVDDDETALDLLMTYLYHKMVAENGLTDTVCRHSTEALVANFRFQLPPEAA